MGEYKRIDCQIFEFIFRISGDPFTTKVKQNFKCFFFGLEDGKHLKKFLVFYSNLTNENLSSGKSLFDFDLEMNNLFCLCIRKLSIELHSIRPQTQQGVEEQSYNY